MPGLSEGDAAGWHPVTQLVSKRLETGHRDDGFRLALAIEGGGMRGVVGAAMARALGHRDVLHVFDDVFGSSAGTYTGVAVIAGKSEEAEDIYYAHLTGREFIDLRRIVRGRPPLSLDFLIDGVCADRIGIDWNAAAASPVPLHPVAFCLEEFRAIDLVGSSDGEDLKRRVRASSTIPVIAGPPTDVGGHRCLDGSLTEPIPYRLAIDAGATHVLALATRPAGIQRRRLSPLEWVLVHGIEARVDRRLAGLERRRSADYNATLIALAEFNRHPRPEPPHVLTLRPAFGSPTVGQLERDVRALKAAAAAGFAEAAAFCDLVATPKLI